MSSIEIETEPITRVWEIFDNQRGLSNSVMNSAAFANFLLLKEHILCPAHQYRLNPPPP
jgi:hypothetical protein